MMLTKIVTDAPLDAARTVVRPRRFSTLTPRTLGATHHRTTLLVEESRVPQTIEGLLALGRWVRVAPKSSASLGDLR